MTPTEFLDILQTAERLKCVTRHCYTSSGRQESVAEHSWRLALMAMLLAPEFPELDMSKVIRMCLIHDLGEAFTGDIPAFDKTRDDEQTEQQQLQNWVHHLPNELRNTLQVLFAEMDALQTPEAKLYKALDKIEAVIQHTESDISTWIPLEYELQLTYGQENMKPFPYLVRLRQLVDTITRNKISDEKALSNKEKSPDF